MKIKKENSKSIKKIPKDRSAILTKIKQIEVPVIKLDIAKILTTIDDKEIMIKFLKDITTPQELSTLQERLNIVMMLKNNIPYREISKRTSSSLVTVTRVSRFFKNESNGGYRWILENIEKFTK